MAHPVVNAISAVMVIANVICRSVSTNIRKNVLTTYIKHQNLSTFHNNYDKENSKAQRPCRM
jgi:hypothetical protein